MWETLEDLPVFDVPPGKMPGLKALNRTDHLL